MPVAIMTGVGVKTTLHQTVDLGRTALTESNSS